MIDEEATFRWKGYRSTDLKPRSHKKVLRICDSCGDGKWVVFNGHRNLCKTCSNRTEDHRRQVGEANKKRVFSEEARRKMSETRKGENNPNYGKCRTEEVKRKISDTRKGKYTGENSPNYGKCRTKETCKKMSESRKGKYIGENNPNYGKHHTEEAKQKISDANKGKHHTEEAKRQMSESRKGKNNSNWKGGISFEPYCEKFDEKFKEFIRGKFGRVCFICGKNEKDNGRKLSVHHVSYDKECMCNGIECEFVSLCTRCNSKVNYGRDRWERLIIDVLQYEGWI